MGVVNLDYVDLLWLIFIFMLVNSLGFGFMNFVIEVMLIDVSIFEN